MREEPSGANSHVLLVDDDTVDAELILRLMPPGFQVHVCSDGRSGLEWLSSRSPDCVLLDYRLPDLDGLDVLDSILGFSRDLPVVILTGAGNEHVAVDALKRGAQDYLIKCELTKSSLRRAMVNAMTKARLESSLRSQWEEFRQFAHSAAHDLRAPLRRIRSWAQMLADCAGFGERSSEEMQILLRMQASVGDMSSLIDGLLDYARAHRDGRDAEPVDLNVVVRQAIENVGQVVEERKATIDVGSLPKVCGDEAALVSLFQNLIGNALKFNYGSPHVGVSAERLADVERVTVSDDGIGISPDHLEQVFAPFERAHECESFSGSGLGLATCERIVEALGGSIRVESQLEVGTSFHVEFPIAVGAVTGALSEHA